MRKNEDKPRKLLLFFPVYIHYFFLVRRDLEQKHKKIKDAELGKKNKHNNVLIAYQRLQIKHQLKDNVT